MVSEAGELHVRGSKRPPGEAVSFGEPLGLPHLRYHFSRTAEISGNFWKFPDLGILAEKSSGNTIFSEISKVLMLVSPAKKSAGNTMVWGGGRGGWGGIGVRV